MISLFLILTTFSPLSLLVVLPMKASSVSAVREQPPQHQVFISFRGVDGWNFVSHLIKALQSENINVYIYAKEEKGYQMHELLSRIEESRIALTILSPMYPVSDWCIRELDRIKDCTVKGSLVTIPIFYKVEPSKVRLLEGDFGYTFKRFFDGYRMEEKWEAAFKFVSNKKGITVDGKRNESYVIDRIVTVVKIALKQIASKESENVDTGKYGIIQQCLKVLVQKMDFNKIRSQLGMINSSAVLYIAGTSMAGILIEEGSLFLALCGHPVLIDYGKKRLWLEKASGKRCIMVPAMDLNIMWADHLEYWCWEPEARFGRIAKLMEVYRFDIRGRINTRFLSPATRYSAYIGFKKGDGCEGFNDTPVEAVVEEVDKEPSRRFVCFDEAMSRRNIVKPKERPDGWMEVELGEFFTEGVLHNDEIEIRVIESKEQNRMQGLIILGIEICPPKLHYCKDDSEVMKEIEVDVKRMLKANRSRNIDTGARIRQSCKESRQKLIAIIGCLLLPFLCLQRIVYTTTPSLGEGGGDIDKIVDIPKVLEYIPAERTKITIDKDSDFPPGKNGGKPERFCSSDAKTNANLLDRTITNSPMDGKPPQIQVFINFRGVQLRNSFVGYLVHALQIREVNVFIDNYEKRGEDLNTLFKRIEESGIAIAVFSSMYAESKWCLDELVKIEERMHQSLLKVIPIFYKVNPTDVKKLKGEFGDHFRDKEHKYGSDAPLIKAWKKAIVSVTHKHALVYDGKSDALEIVFVETIVKHVLEMLQSISTGESSQSSN